MKRIEYQVVSQPRWTDGGAVEEIIEVSARDINSGFRKVTKLATNDPRWEVCSVKFWAVTS